MDIITIKCPFYCELYKYTVIIDIDTFYSVAHSNLTITLYL
jgi:hypothetical protein